MFIWTILLLLFGASLGEMIDTENVNDSCGKGNKKLCGKNQSIRTRFFCRDMLSSDFFFNIDRIS